MMTYLHFFVFSPISTSVGCLSDRDDPAGRRPTSKRPASVNRQASISSSQTGHDRESDLGAELA
jgi:hypothetical protein